VKELNAHSLTIGAGEDGLDLEKSNCLRRGEKSTISESERAKTDEQRRPGWWPNISLKSEETIRSKCKLGRGESNQRETVGRE
jgi:hypothetical protein